MTAIDTPRAAHDTPATRRRRRALRLAIGRILDRYTGWVAAGALVTGTAPGVLF